MSTNKTTKRVLGRMIGRELSAAELCAVSGGSGATQPVAGSSGRDTDYS
jgi:hypothetical protein